MANKHISSLQYMEAAHQHIIAGIHVEAYPILDFKGRPRGWEAVTREGVFVRGTGRRKSEALASLEQAL